MDPDIARPVWAEDLCNIITSIETRLFNKKALDQETMSQIEVIRPRLQCLKINPNVLLYHYERFYRESESKSQPDHYTYPN